MKNVIDKIIQDEKITVDSDASNVISAYYTHGLNMGGFYTRLFDEESDYILLESMHENIKPYLGEYKRLAKSVKFYIRNL